MADEVKYTILRSPLNVDVRYYAEGDHGRCGVTDLDKAHLFDTFHEALTAVATFISGQGGPVTDRTIIGVALQQQEDFETVDIFDPRQASAFVLHFEYRNDAGVVTSSTVPVLYGTFEKALRGIAAYGHSTAALDSLRFVPVLRKQVVTRTSRRVELGEVVAPKP